LTAHAPIPRGVREELAVLIPRCRRNDFGNNSRDIHGGFGVDLNHGSDYLQREPICDRDRRPSHILWIAPSITGRSKPADYNDRRRMRHVRVVMNGRGRNYFANPLGLFAAVLRGRFAPLAMEL
jgi:hypothetical protein